MTSSQNLKVSAKARFECLRRGKYTRCCGFQKCPVCGGVAYLMVNTITSMFICSGGQENHCFENDKGKISTRLEA